MAIYYFHLISNSGLLADDEGQELPDVAAVKKQAIVEARSMLAEDMLAGELNIGCSIEVQDETGEHVLTLPFADVYTINRSRLRPVDTGDPSIVRSGREQDCAQTGS